MRSPARPCARWSTISPGSRRMTCSRRTGRNGHGRRVRARSPWCGASHPRPRGPRQRRSGGGRRKKFCTTSYRPRVTRHKVDHGNTGLKNPLAATQAGFAFSRDPGHVPPLCRVPSGHCAWCCSRGVRRSRASAGAGGLRGALRCILPSPFLLPANGFVGPAILKRRARLLG